MTRYHVYKWMSLESCANFESLELAYRHAIELLRSDNALYAIRIVSTSCIPARSRLFVNHYDLEHPRQELL